MDEIMDFAVIPELGEVIDTEGQFFWQPGNESGIIKTTDGKFVAVYNVKSFDDGVKDLRKRGALCNLNKRKLVRTELCCIRNSESEAERWLNETKSKDSHS